MKILVDAQSLQWAVRERGAGKYTISFIKSLLKQSVEVHVLINDGEHYEFALNECLQLLDASNIHSFSYAIGVLDRDQVINRINPDIYHVIDPLAPDIINAPLAHDTIKCVGTVHDLIIFKFEQYRIYGDEFADTFEANMQRLYKFDHIITLTEHVKTDVINMTSVKEENITVCSSAMNLQLLYEKESHLKLNKFILYVGGNDYRKNLQVLVDSYKILPQQVKDEYSLVIVGPYEQPLHIDEAVVFHASNSELVSLYKHASLFVFPSLDEGFGMPLVEAMYYGCPLICSDTAVSREIVGNIDCYFDPASPRDLQKKILSHLYNDDKLAKNKMHGLERAKCYNWDIVISNNINVYESIL